MNRVWKCVATASVSLMFASFTLANTASAADGTSQTDPSATVVDATTNAVKGLDTGTAIAVVDAVDAVAGAGVANTVADTTTKQADGSTVTVAADGVVVDVPATGDQPVAVQTPSGPVTIDLPVPAGTKATVVAGVSVFPTADGAVTQNVTDTGAARTSFVLNGSDAPTSYPVTITANGDGSLRLEADGSISVLNPDGSTNSMLAQPWAKDANETQVPSWYTVEGNTVTQHINTANVTAWPVVADPFWNVFGNYMKCILGVGVPIGVALFFADVIGPAVLINLAFGKALSYDPSGPPGLGSVLKPLGRAYARRIYNSCYRFIRS